MIPSLGVTRKEKYVTAFSEYETRPEVTIYSETDKIVTSRRDRLGTMWVTNQDL
jgi:hypothetical protein